ncbi:MAG: hypothetical protein IT345_09585 [Trueperaceae bacterium]|nr:hypothetical protein [Trueperaceae bacterium]
MLLSYADYVHLAGNQRSQLEALSMPDMADVAFDPSEVGLRLSVPDFEG